MTHGTSGPRKSVTPETHCVYLCYKNESVVAELVTAACWTAQEVESGNVEKSESLQKAAALKAEAMLLRAKMGENQLSKYRTEYTAR